MRRSIATRLLKLEQRAARVKPPVQRERKPFDWHNFHRVSAELLGLPVPTDDELAELDALAAAAPLRRPGEPFDWGAYAKLGEAVCGAEPEPEEPAAE